MAKWDSLGVHDFTDPETWQLKPEGGWASADDWDSTFTLEPGEGETFNVNSVRIRFSDHAEMHAPLIVSYYVGDTVVATTVYATKDDFFDRCSEFKLFEVAGTESYESNIFAFEYDFITPLVLQTDPTKGLTKMTMHIEDHQPYKQKDGTGPGGVGCADAEIVRIRYPDIEVITS